MLSHMYLLISKLLSTLSRKYLLSALVFIFVSNTFQTKYIVNFILLYHCNRVQVVFIVAILPGPKVKSLPVPSENNLQYTYKCNALANWYLTLAVVALFHVTRISR